MPSLCEILRYQLDFTTWATERMLSAAAELTPEELAHDFKTSDKSILGTLAHNYRAERTWLNRMHGKRVDFRVDGDDALEALETNWPAVRVGWADWASTLTEEAAASDLNYSDLKGNTWTQPIWTVVLHVTNHSTHHRGQAVGFIRTIGHTPPNVDLISYARLRG